LDIGKAVDACEVAAPAVFYDAPVSGGTAGAKAGTLTFMVGTSQIDPLFPLIEQILGYMGENIYPMGGRSLGLAAKLSNNYLSGIIAIATSEAMNLGMRLGIDPIALSRCFAASSGGNWV
jgi:3-hydroxyisobutyrate/3-hydroxypropionate dehydrogenase